MIIQELKQTLFGVYEITPEAGSAFFLRSEYLCIVPCEKLSVNECLNDEETADVYRASLIYKVEMSAMLYLSRAEQCRTALSSKLLKKGFDKNHVEIALDYLESVSYLSDERFAGAWLRNRAIDHAEGRIRLSAELANRGIGRDISKKAIEDFFEEHDEHELCGIALAKLIRQRKSEDKIYASLQRSGFSGKIIRSVLNEQKK